MQRALNSGKENIFKDSVKTPVIAEQLPDTLILVLTTNDVDDENACVLVRKIVLLIIPAYIIKRRTDPTANT